MQTDLASAPTSSVLHRTQPTVLAAANINVNIPPTARELKYRLQRRLNLPFVTSVPLFFFFNTPPILHRKRLQGLPKLHHVLGT